MFKKKGFGCPQYAIKCALGEVINNSYNNV